VITLSVKGKTLGEVAETMFTALHNELDTSSGVDSVLKATGQLFLKDIEEGIRATDPELGLKAEYNDLVEEWLASTAWSTSAAAQYYQDKATDVAAGAGAAAGARGLTKAVGRIIERARKNRGVWALGVGERGLAIEKRLGKNTPDTFPVIDRIKNREATSIKSIDLTLPSYSTPSGIKKEVNKYINQLYNFEQKTHSNFTIKRSDWDKKVLELVIPPGASAEQRLALQELANHAAYNGMEMRIIEFAK
jgi:hypothetical protein